MAKVKKKKIRRNVNKGIVYIKATFNNTIVTMTDATGDVICWATAGTVGFKGSRKSTPFAAQRAAETVAEKAAKVGVREVEIRVKGPWCWSRKCDHWACRRPEWRLNRLKISRRCRTMAVGHLSVAACKFGASLVCFDLILRWGRK